MARTFLDIPFSGDPQTVDAVVRQTLTIDNYREIPYGAEIVWKMGTGLMTAMHYIKVEYPAANTLRLAGWVQIGLGSVGGKERDLTGFTGIIPKKSVQATMEKIRAAVWSMENGGQQPADQPQTTVLEYDAPPLQSYMPDVDLQDPTEPEPPAPQPQAPSTECGTPPPLQSYMPDVDLQDPTEPEPPAPQEYMPEADLQDPTEQYLPPMEYNPETDRIDNTSQGKQKLFCPSCGAHLQIQAGNKRFHVVCPRCKHDFFYQP